MECNVLYVCMYVWMYVVCCMYGWMHHTLYFDVVHVFVCNLNGSELRLGLGERAGDLPRGGDWGAGRVHLHGGDDSCLGREKEEY